MSGHTRWCAPAWTTRSDSRAGSAHAPQHRFASLCGCKRQTGRSTINMGKAEQQKAQGAAYCGKPLQLLPAEFSNHIPGQGNRMILTGELVSRYPLRGGELAFPVCIEVHGRIAIDLRGKT